MKSLLFRICLMLTLVAAFAIGSQSFALTNLLVNPGFEDGGGSYNGWFTFGTGVQLSLPGGDNIIRTGSAASKIYGEFSGCPGSPTFSVGGYGQAFTPTAGKVYQFNGYSFVSSGDPIPGTDTCNKNRCIAKLVFWDAASGGNEICSNEIIIGDGNTVTDQWNAFSVSAPAPTGALRVEALILYLQPACDPGAVFVDDTSLYETSPTSEPNRLNNPSFTNNLSGWTTFGNVYYDARSWAVRTPRGSAKMFSTFNPNSDTGIYQSFRAAPDSGYKLDVYSLNTCRETPITGTNDNSAIALIQFRDATNAVIGSAQTVIVDNTAPLGTWTKHTVFAFGPAGAESVDVYFLFISPSLAGGSMWIDDASLQVMPPAGIGDGTGPIGLELHQNTPNPFSSATTIRFDLPRSTSVKLCVYDVRGDLVSTILDKQMTEGRKEIAWDARDDRGETVATGIYFCRLVTGDATLTKKMMFLQ